MFGVIFNVIFWVILTMDGIFIKLGCIPGCPTMFGCILGCIPGCIPCITGVPGCWRVGWVGCTVDGEGEVLVAAGCGCVRFGRIVGVGVGGVVLGEGGLAGGVGLAGGDGLTGALGSIGSGNID